MKTHIVKVIPESPAMHANGEVGVGARCEDSLHASLAAKSTEPFARIEDAAADTKFSYNLKFDDAYSACQQCPKYIPASSNGASI
jgi:hypothetical protein